jgi:hypothetical protein
MFSGSPTKSGMYKICKTCRDLQRGITEKLCNICMELKSIKSFAKSKTNRDGYHNQCKKCMGKYFYEYYRKNKEKKYRYDRLRYIQKRGEILEKDRQKYLENREYYLTKQSEWAKSNPHIVRCQSSQKRARRKNAAPPWLNEAHKREIELMHLLAKALERDTGKRYHVDHIIPLKHKNMCGLHVPWNLRVIPEGENMKKNNKFLPELGLTS